MLLKERKVMAIVTTNPARVLIRLIDQPVLTHEQIFQLAHFIDAYEIEKQLQESLVIDIHKVTAAGQIELIMTPKTGLSYDEIASHLNQVITYALKNSNLEGSQWEIIEISFQIVKPGKPSFVYDNLHAAFKAE
jgi:hypothetical protein